MLARLRGNLCEIALAAAVAVVLAAVVAVILGSSAARADAARRSAEVRASNRAALETMDPCRRRAVLYASDAERLRAALATC